MVGSARLGVRLLERGERGLALQEWAVEDH